MKILKHVKANLFPIIMVLIYLIIFLINPKIGIFSAQKSIDYIKEMLLVIPAIFILTALLDT